MYYKNRMFLEERFLPRGDDSKFTPILSVYWRVAAKLAIYRNFRNCTRIFFEGIPTFYLGAMSI
ncbi:hypothetical protein CH380_20845 [Leptospira adleri]|uniref:Uncharacterized protein n=1 Tax=Leptospira adleri TaxID=2023186 RepID=A0A2M9YIB7_9LEPT|nr:hypothetical protein CH380_20845 [Leptospira adleri]PJZ60209.1 hypothetical protein CH376_19595 [Leptospira adleri]